MDKIPKILTNTRVSEVNGLLQQIIDEFNKGDYSTDAYMSQAFQQVITINGQLGEAIKRDAIESDLADLDDVSDNAITLLHGLVKGYTCHPDNMIANAARLLFKMIEKYGLEVKSKSYREEYPLLASMISESKTEEYAACIVQLPGCDVRFEQLETAVDNFNTRQNDYYSVKDERSEMETASVLKKRLIGLMNDDVAPYLFVMQKVNGDVYADLTHFITKRITENNSVVRNRKNKIETSS
ncbi:MAG: DUF6261 family protein [Carboxylicivirga sp.]|jgi:hypothetical protein|nr:DUF6261 family protein [Carboxylicivirga sp.]MCT4648026.1 DUF6261 family protein [Carboxylicivirga sp.]